MLFGAKQSISFDIQKIMEILPHRYPFLLIDKVVDLIPNEKIIALKNVTINEPFFMGHFPQKPVMPGVLIVEAMAQASGLLAVGSDESLKTQNNLFYFLSIDGAKFRIPVVPGDTLMIHSTLTKTRSLVSRFMCEVFVDSKKVSEAEISAKVVKGEVSQ